MLNLARMITRLMLVVSFALCATNAAHARSHRRNPEPTAGVATKPDAKIPTEQKRDPADVALDRKIKGICRGC
jgi:hypothetical protein